jgi:hypothetical protein
VTRTRPIIKPRGASRCTARKDAHLDHPKSLRKGLSGTGGVLHRGTAVLTRCRWPKSSLDATAGPVTFVPLPAAARIMTEV